MRHRPLRDIKNHLKLRGLGLGLRADSGSKGLSMINALSSPRLNLKKHLNGGYTFSTQRPFSFARSGEAQVFKTAQSGEMGWLQDKWGG